MGRPIAARAPRLWSLSARRAAGDVGRRAATSRAGAEASASTSVVVEPCRQTLSPNPLRNGVPVELTERELRDTVAVMGEWDQDGAREAQSALEWLGWEGEGSL